MSMRSSCALLLAILAACGSSDGGDSGGQQSGAPTYTQDIQPILQQKCGPCHTSDAEGGFNHATDYVATQQPSEACDGMVVYECMLVRVRDGSMPENAGCTGDAVADGDNPACLDAAEQDLLAAWVAAEAPKGTGGTPPPPRPDADPDDDTGDEPGGW